MTTEYGQWQLNKASSIAAEANLIKNTLVSVPETERYDLSGSPLEVRSYLGRMGFPGKTGRFSFDPEKLVLGYIDRHIVGERVEINYPHKIGGRIVSKSGLLMRPKDADVLFSACARELGISLPVLRSAISGFSG